MDQPAPAALLAALPKAELHLHLEGSIAPYTVVELAARHGLEVTPQEAAARYEFEDFQGFLEAFKWVTSFLRDPADYALIAERLGRDLLGQNVAYAEITVSIGVMLRRGQDVEANFLALHETGENLRRRGLRTRWIFDATRQFGPDAALEVARWASRLQSMGVVALGMGGDELACPAEAFRAAYDLARRDGLHALVHAGEIGSPESVREAVDQLGAERIGHGIAAAREPELIAELTRKGIAFECCPTSNLRTGALARQIGVAAPGIEDHPLRRLFSQGARVALATDDPAMFCTSLNREYALAAAMGFSPRELARLAGMSYDAAFLSPAEKEELLRPFRSKVKELGLV